MCPSVVETYSRYYPGEPESDGKKSAVSEKVLFFQSLIAGRMSDLWMGLFGARLRGEGAGGRRKEEDPGGGGEQEVWEEKQVSA